MYQLIIHNPNSTHNFNAPNPTLAVEYWPLLLLEVITTIPYNPNTTYDIMDLTTGELLAYDIPLNQ